MIAITRKFEFEAAHKLDNHSGKCRYLHGHSYKLEITIKGEICSDGMIIDFSIFKEIIQTRIIVKLDHKYLNEIFDFSPTVERMTEWIVKNLYNYFKDFLHVKLWRVKLWETSNCHAEWENDDVVM